MTEFSTLLADPAAKDARQRLEELSQAVVPVEALDFLYGLVRVTKPTLVLQTCVGSGFEAAAIACALEANGRGGLWTLVKDPEIARGARRLWSNLGVGAWIQAVPETLADFVRQYPGPYFELVLLNSREAEADLELLSQHRLVHGTAVVARTSHASWSGERRPGLYLGSGLTAVPVSRQGIG